MRTRAQLPNPQRVSGADRYATSVAVADHFAEAVGATKVVLASGDPSGLVDALPAGAIRALTVLTTPGGLPPVVRDWLVRIDPSLGQVDVVGGPSAVSPTAFSRPAAPSTDRRGPRARHRRTVTKAPYGGARWRSSRCRLPSSRLM